MVFQRKNPSQLQSQLEAMNAKPTFENNGEGEWKPTIDSSGNGGARIRFLPAKKDEDTAFVKLFNHGFKKNGKWFIENCPTTKAKDCPLCRQNSQLWNSGLESDKAIARQRKRKLSYWANILVVMDPGNPENNGKVFKYRFGQKIMEKIQGMINVDEAMGDVPVDVTCVFGGADFALKQKKVSDFPNYDDSKFFAVGEITNINNPEMQKFLMDNMHDLNEIVSDDKFLPYEELEKKLSSMEGQQHNASSASDTFDQQLAAFEQNNAPAGHYNSAPAQPMSNYQPAQQAPQYAPVAPPVQQDDTPPFEVGTAAELSDLDELLADIF